MYLFQCQFVLSNDLVLQAKDKLRSWYIRVLLKVNSWYGEQALQFSLGDRIWCVLHHMRPASENWMHGIWKWFLRINSPSSTICLKKVNKSIGKSGTKNTQVCNRCSISVRIRILSPCITSGNHDSSYISMFNY